MASTPGWYSVSRDWETTLVSQVVERAGTPPDTSLLLEGAGSRGSYLEALYAKRLGTTGSNVVVHLHLKHPDGDTYFLIGSVAVAASSLPALGSDIATIDLSAILPITRFPLPKTHGTSNNRMLRIAPGVKVYVSLDRGLSPDGLVVWGHGGDLIEDGESDATINVIAVVPNQSKEIFLEVMGGGGTGISSVYINTGVLTELLGAGGTTTSTISVSGAGGVLEVLPGTNIPPEVSYGAGGTLEVMQVPNVGYSAEAQGVIDYLTNGTYTSTDQDQIATLVDGLVAAGLWSDFLLFWVAASPVEADAYLDWTLNGYDGTKNGSGGWTANQGLNPGADNSIYVNSGFTPSIDLPDLNSFTAGVWSNTNNANGAYVEFGCTDGANLLFLQARDVVNDLYFATNSINLQSIGSVTDCSGLLMIGRSDSTTSFAYRNNGTLGSGGSTSNSAPSQTIHFAGYNNNGTNIASPDRELAVFFVINRAIDTAERDTIYSLVSDYLTYRSSAGVSVNGAGGVLEVVASSTSTDSSISVSSAGGALEVTADKTTTTTGGGGYTPSLDFSDDRNSGYLGAI